MLKMTNPQNYLKTNNMFQIPLAQIQILINKQIPEEEKKILNKEEKKIFDFQFSSKEEYISFLGEYLNVIYSNLLEDEKNLKVKPNCEYRNQQGDP